MKKSVKILITVSASVLVLALLLFAGFSWLANSVETYQTSLLNSPPGLQPFYKDIWDHSGQADYTRVPEPSWTITFMGKTYTGSYKQTERLDATDYLYDTRRDLYEVGTTLKFYIGNRSRKLVGISFSGADSSQLHEEQSKPVSQETEAYAVAQAKIVVSELANPEEYTQKVELKTDSRGFSYYLVTFNKFIAGIETTDYITVHLTTNGTLVSMESSGNLGVFDGYLPGILLKARLSANLYTVARESVKTVAKRGIKANYIGHYPEIQKICLTPAGEIAVFTRLRIQYNHYSSQNEPYSILGTLDLTTILSK